MSLYVLYEGPTGYAIFKHEASEEIDAAPKELQKSGALKLVASTSFITPKSAPDDCACASEGPLSGFLSEFLKSTMSKEVGDDSNWELGVSDPCVGDAIHELLGFKIVSNEAISEMACCIRLNAEKLLPNSQKGDIDERAFDVKFNVYHSRKMIIQASALLEHLDKGVNLLGVRVKEWYGLHFPELAKEVPEPSKYCKLVLLLGQRAELAEYDPTEIQASTSVIVGGDDALAGRIYEKAVCSMGGDLDEFDWENIRALAKRVGALYEYRVSLQQYFSDKMMIVTPDHTTLIDQESGAKLISASSLANLDKIPASTIRILGADKALFRALKKKKGDTPKYGLLYSSHFQQKESRGKISRYLANKAALAGRSDCLMDAQPPVVGDKEDQVEAPPQSNQVD